MKFAAFLKAGLVCIFATTAQAQSVAQEKESSSSITSTTKLQFPSDKLRVSYFGDVTVPASRTERGEWYHEPGISYRLSSASLRLKLALTQYFTRTDRRDNLFELGDPSIGVSKSSLVRFNKFNLYGGLNYSPGTSEYSQKKQRVGAIGTTLIPSLSSNGRRLNLDWMTSVKYYFYVADDDLTAQNKRDLDRGRMSQIKLEFRPALTYRISDRFDALLGGHIVFYQNRGRDLGEWVRTKNALHIGANYNVLKSLSIRPEVRFPNPEDLNIETVEAGMLLFASL